MGLLSKLHLADAGFYLHPFFYLILCCFKEIVKI